MLAQAGIPAPLATKRLLPVEELLAAIRARPGGAQKVDQLLTRIAPLRAGPGGGARPGIPSTSAPPRAAGGPTVTVPATVQPYGLRLTPTSPGRPGGAPPRLRFHIVEYEHGRVLLRGYREFNVHGSGVFPVSQVLFSISVPHDAYVINVEGICTGSYSPSAALYRVANTVFDQIVPPNPDRAGELDRWSVPPREFRPGPCRFPSALELAAGLHTFAFQYSGEFMEFLGLSVLAIP